MRSVLCFAILANFLVSCGSDTVRSGERTAGTDTIAAATKQQDPVPRTTKAAPGSYQSPNEPILAARIDEHFGSQWKILNDERATWMKEVFAYFIEPGRKTNPDYPYIATGDFNGDHKTDTVAMVSDSIHSTYRLALFVQGKKPELWDDIDLVGDGALSTITDRIIELPFGEKTKKRKLPHDAICITYFERARYAVYLDKGKWKKLKLADE